MRTFSTRAFSISIAAAMVLVAGCAGDRAVMPTAPLSAAPGALSSFLSVSNPAPVAGDTVAVSISAARGTNVAATGSFTARISYDTTGLQLVGADPSNDGLVAANAVSGTIIVAGASASGFSTSRLASIEVLVKNPAALSSLQLDMSELNAVDFQDQRHLMSVDRRLYRARN